MLQTHIFLKPCVITYKEKDLKMVKRALLIGINYIGTPNELSGCINDIYNVFNFLRIYRGYSQSDMIIMTDENASLRNSASYPTKANIIAAINQFVQGIKPGDELFFHYSGHGTLIYDANGDEQSGADSCLCPVDCMQGKLIVDDEIRSLLINRIPSGVRLYVVLDCCHNGTGCDIRYRYDDSSILLPPNKWITRQGLGIFNRYANTAGDVYMISGCRDDQTSADTVFDNKAAGALTWCAIYLLRKNAGSPTYSWSLFLRDLRYILRGFGYSQVPQIMTGKLIPPTSPVFSPPSSTLNAPPIQALPSYMAIALGSKSIHNSSIPSPQKSMSIMYLS